MEGVPESLVPSDGNTRLRRLVEILGFDPMPLEDLNVPCVSEVVTGWDRNSGPLAYRQFFDTPAPSLYSHDDTFQKLLSREGIGKHLRMGYDDIGFNQYIPARENTQFLHPFLNDLPDLLDIVFGATPDEDLVFFFHGTLLVSPFPDLSRETGISLSH